MRFDLSPPLVAPAIGERVTVTLSASLVCGLRARGADVTASRIEELLDSGVDNATGTVRMAIGRRVQLHDTTVEVCAAEHLVLIDSDELGPLAGVFASSLGLAVAPPGAEELLG